MTRHVFRAMGTDVELLVDGSGTEVACALLAAEREVERLEGLLSRFRPESELSRLNAAGALEAGPELRELVALALDARERTGGRFDPTVHEALVAAGYDRTWDEVDGSRARGDSVPAGGDVRLRGTRVELGGGVRLDLGGIAKGWTADRLAARLAPLGPSLANVGGDLAVAGVPADGFWPVGIDTPGGTVTLGVREGGLATSGRDRRRWTANGEERHHLIDPSTGRPSSSDLLTVTVAAPTAVEAEITAKALFLSGTEAAGLEADATGIPALLVTESGETVFAGGLS